MVLDVRPMRGSKTRADPDASRLSGRAQIDLWCKRGEGQAAIAGGAMTITVGAMKDEPCTAERAQADEDHARRTFAGHWLEPTRRRDHAGRRIAIAFPARDALTKKKRAALRPFSL